MPRRKLPKEVETKILTMSGRRCCLCVGLNGDWGIKQGQIAHIDRDPSNNTLDNLAFLCLSHHDQCDSKTSQSKGITAAEVKHYRKSLYAHLVVDRAVSASQSSKRIKTSKTRNKAKSPVKGPNFDKWFAQVLRLSLPVDRDREYKHIAVKALYSDQPHIARRAAQLLSLPVDRDEVNWMIFDYYLTNGNTEEAEQVIHRFSLPVDGDKARKKVLRAYSGG